MHNPPEKMKLTQKMNIWKDQKKKKKKNKEAQRNTGCPASQNTTEKNPITFQVSKSFGHFKNQCSYIRCFHFDREDHMKANCLIKKIDTLLKETAEEKEEINKKKQRKKKEEKKRNLA